MQAMIINTLFTLAMLALALWDYISYGKQKHRDFKSIIMSVGVLGTFVGIFIGLQEFDTSHIEESVPLLLDGLKIAFYTSILGMALAILLSIAQKSKVVKSDMENMMEYFSLQASKLDDLGELKKLVVLNENLLESQKQAHKEHQSLQTQNFSMIQNEFSQTNQALKEAMHHLAQGASKELIGALEGVIKDFNQKITEQFGDNFKELNGAVMQLISWQESYKDSIVGIESSLKSTLEVFEKSKESLSLIVKRNQEVIDIYTALAHSIEASRVENQKLSSLLSGFDKMHENANVALNSVDSLIKTLESSHAQTMDLTKDSLEGVRKFLQEGSSQAKEHAKDSLKAFETTLEQSSLKAQDFTQNTLESLREFLQEKTQAQNQYTQEILKNLEDFLTSSTTQTQDFTKNSLEGLTSFLEAQTQKHQEQTTQILQQNTKALQDGHRELSTSLVDLQSQFTQFNTQYITQNKNQLEELLAGLKSDLKDFMEHLQTSDSELKHKNLELLSSISESIQNRIAEIKESFNNALEILSNAQKESLLLIENQAKKGDDTLIRHTQNLEASFEKTNHHFNEINLQTQKHLEENSNALEQHIANAIVNLDSLLGNSTKTLQENFNQSKETLQTLSKEIEDSMAVVTKSLDTLLNDTANSLSQSTQNIEESFLSTNETIKNSIESLLTQNTNYSETLAQNLSQNSQNFRDNLQEMIKESKQYQAQTQDQIRETLGETYKNALDSIAIYFKNTFDSYQEGLTKFSQTHLEELQKAQAQSLKSHESLQQDLHQRLADILAKLNTQSQQVLASMQNLASEVVKVSHTRLDEHSKKILESYGELQQKVEKSLISMANHYVQLLEVLTKKSVEAPKNVSAALLSEFNKLQQNLSEALNKTYQSLEQNRKEVDTILRIIQENISSSLSETSTLNTNLCQSLGELDSALSNITLGFRQDYEWFLRRIRELMGARN